MNWQYAEGRVDIEVGDHVELNDGYVDQVDAARFIQEVLSRDCKQGSAWFEFHLKRVHQWVKREEIKRRWWDGPDSNGTEFKEGS